MIHQLFTYTSFDTHASSHFSPRPSLQPFTPLSAREKKFLDGSVWPRILCLELVAVDLKGVRVDQQALSLLSGHHNRVWDGFVSEEEEKIVN